MVKTLLYNRRLLAAAGLALLSSIVPVAVNAQKKLFPRVLASAEVARIAPSNFYFEGQSGPVQMRNTAAIELETNRHVIAGLVDTSGYSAETKEKAQGFITTSLPIVIGGENLPVGMYGLGFTDGKINVYDLSGSLVLSVSTSIDKALRRPRPLAMTSSPDGLRLYAGRAYAIIAAR